MRRVFVVIALLMSVGAVPHAAHSQTTRFSGVRADNTRGQRPFFYLRPGDGVMNGAVTLGAGTGVLSGLEGRVSYWVELRRPP